MNSSRPWYPLGLLSLSLFLLLIVMPLTRQGMFIDGVVYAAIAKNLALGYGSLWKPHYSQIDYIEFYDHPPLAFYFQSLFFKLFGQGFGVERLYSLLMAIGQFTCIAWYWLKKEKSTFYTLALLLLLWLLIPLNLKYADNLLEGTLTLFTTGASLILLLKTKSTPAFIAQYIVSAILISVAFFCNGPTAFFPLAIPFIVALLDEQTTVYQGIDRTVFLGLISALLLCCFYFFVPAALFNTRKYFELQLLVSMNGIRSPRFEGIGHLQIINLYFRACWLASIFTCLCIAIAAKINNQIIYKKIISSLKNKKFFLFFLLSLIASLPVGISPRQAFNYIMPAAPLITLAMMYLCIEPFNTIINYCKTQPQFVKITFRLSLLLFVVSLITVINLAAGFNKDKDMLSDINTIIHYCKHDDILSVSHPVYYNWYTGAYLSRNSMMSITRKKNRPYYLAFKNEVIPANYHVIDLPLSYYTLASREER